MFTKFDGGIKIRGWKISVQKSPMAAGSDVDHLEGELGLPSVPEMLFLKSSLRLEHDNGFIYDFNARDALKGVALADPGFGVAASSTWSSGNKAHLEKIQSENSESTSALKLFDWTYSTKYKGTLSQNGKVLSEDEVAAKGIATATTEKINIDKLKQPDPILFWDDCILYEDELSDNGDASLSVRIRVMPTCLLVLQRFFLRVDHVLFRLYETRLYLELHKNYFIREWIHKEKDSASVQEIFGEEFPTKCRDANALGEVLPQKDYILEKVQFKE